MIKIHAEGNSTFVSESEGIRIFNEIALLIKVAA